MKHLRQYKRLSLLLFALATVSLHVQIVYACSAMGEQSTCCCDESASEPCGKTESFHSGLSASAQACCEVSLSPDLDVEAVFTPAAPQVKSGAKPLAPPPPISAVVTPGARVPAGKAAPLPDRQPAPAIYLTTRRLRI